MIDEREIEELLPWYVTGKLTPSEQRQVEHYLEQHREMQAKLQMVRDEKNAVIAANEGIALPVSVNFAKLKQQINAYEAETQVTSQAELQTAQTASRTASDLVDRIGNFLNAKSLVSWFIDNEILVLRTGFATASLVIAIMAAVWGMSSGGPGAGYITASGPNAEATQAKAHTKLLISFADQAKLEDVSALLEEIGGEIVSGPKAGGIYVVALTGKNLTDYDKDKLVESLQKRTDLILFVGVAK